jgi:hypothetical protein
MSPAFSSTRTRISAAWRSGESPAALTERTLCTPRASDAARATAARSAPVSGVEREATIVITLILPLAPPPRTGAARLAALLLGELAGRKALLLLLTSLPSEGSVALVKTATRIQKITIGTRKRTTKRARASKAASTVNGMRAMMAHGRFVVIGPGVEPGLLPGR